MSARIMNSTTGSGRAHPIEPSGVCCACHACFSRTSTKDSMTSTGPTAAQWRAWPPAASARRPSTAPPRRTTDHQGPKRHSTDSHLTPTFGGLWQRYQRSDPLLARAIVKLIFCQCRSLQLAHMRILIGVVSPRTPKNQPRRALSSQAK